MKVAVFSTHVLWTPHFETELEIIRKHLDSRDEVHHVVCDKALGVCDLVVDHGLSVGADPFTRRAQTCKRCINRRNAGVRLLGGKVSTLQILGSSHDVVRKPDLEFSSVDELRQYKIDNYEIGESILSSLISYTRDPNLQIESHRRLVFGYLGTCAQLYHSTLALLNREPYDAVYVFNGRFAHTRAIYRACQAMNVTCLIHERGHDIHHYELFRNVTPHDINHRLSEIRRHWESEPDQDKKAEVGATFYRERLSGVEQSWFSFVNDQNLGELPEDWDPTKRNIAIFNSSEDEFSSMGEEWKNPLYENQLDGLIQIANDPRVTSDKSIRLYLRVHPNLKGAPRAYLDKLQSLNSGQLTVISPHSTLSTYTLLLSCEKALTFGSNVGIEAVYWGKPSILAGRNVYRDLDGTYNPGSHQELIDLLLADLEPKSKLAALMYGYYLKTYGTPFKYFEADGIQSGRFRGHNLASSDRSLFRRAAGRIARLLRRAGNGSMARS